MLIEFGHLPKIPSYLWRIFLKMVLKKLRFFMEKRKLSWKILRWKQKFSGVIRLVSRENFKIFIFLNHKRKRKNQSVLTWLSHQYSWRYGLQSLGSNFLWPGRSFNNPKKFVIFDIFKFGVTGVRWVSIEWWWFVSDSIPLGPWDRWFIKSSSTPWALWDLSDDKEKFHSSLQNFGQLSKIAVIWNQETEDFVRNAWLSSL